LDINNFYHPDNGYMDIFVFKQTGYTTCVMIWS